jgi:predicted transcriptional regulator
MKNNIENLWNELKSVDNSEKEFFAISESIADIISKIVIERNRLNISQRDLAKMTGLKQSAIARLESLSVMPRIDTIVKVCYHLNLEFELSTKLEIQNHSSTFVILNNENHKNNVYSNIDNSEYIVPSYINEPVGKGYPKCIS